MNSNKVKLYLYVEICKFFDSFCTKMYRYANRTKTNFSWRRRLSTQRKSEIPPVHNLDSVLLLLTSSFIGNLKSIGMISIYQYLQLLHTLYQDQYLPGCLAM